MRPFGRRSGSGQTGRYGKMHRMNNSGAKVALGVLVAVAAILVGAGLWYDSSRSSTPAPVSSDAAPRYEPPTPTRPVRLAVIGDKFSYAEIESAQLPWPVTLTNERGWYVNSQATPGTGYVAGGNLSFIDRVAGATRTSPDLIVVAGGSEDENVPGPVHERAAGLYSDLKRVSPDSTIVVVGPIGTSSTPSPGLQAVNDAVRLAAEQADIEFVEALDWLATPGLVESGGRLTAEGGRVLHDRIASAVPDREEVSE